MDEHNFELGQKVRVIRVGSPRHGQFGIITNLSVKIHRVKFDDGMELLFSTRSLELVEEPKPVKKELAFPDTFPAVVRMKVRDEIKHYLITGDDQIYINPHDDSILSIYNEGIFTIGGDSPKSVYMGFVAIDDNVKMSFKPEYKEDYPFWAGDECDIDVDITSIEDVGANSSIVISTQGWSYHVEWISDESFTVYSEATPFDQEVFDKKASEILAETALGYAECGLAFGMMVKRKNQQPKLHSVCNAVCHAYFRTMCNNKSEEILYGVQFYNNAFDKCSDKTQLGRWLCWVIFDSPWSRFIFQDEIPNVPEIIFAYLEKNPVRVRTDVPANAMMCTFYALRYPYEFPHIMENWDEHVNAGFSPEMAFFLAESMDGDGELRNFEGLHVLLDSYNMNINHLEAFIRKEEGKTTIEPYNTLRGYNSVSVYHGAKINCKGDAISTLKELAEPKVVTENHPVLGEIQKEITPIEDLLEWDKEVRNGK